VAPSLPTEQSGDWIGRYKLLEKIGEGGFGAVYVAEQKEPVKRRVALKIIKLGMDTRQVVARFEAERQALALMDHPNIAKIFDAGATATGRPYFVMELVRGIPITEYCDTKRLPTAKRLELFIQVCRAIQHAHQKGIIHRDIKPSNILVTLHDGVPVPKVIDFGIAKATQAGLTEKTVYTQFQHFIGTPAYMSPEQAEMSGLDIDTRSDIYALGVLLYELLVGKTPFDPKELLAVGLDEMRRTIREREPVRPSTRLRSMIGEELTTTAERRGAEAPRLISLLRGDLDWIVMKCLEKDRTRRYEAAIGLAIDVQRHLDNEPVLARPPSAAYRLRKFVRRNKVAVGVVASVAAALVLGICASTWQAIRATTAKQESEANTYAADMNEAQQALLADDLGKARTLLARYRSGSGMEHLRGFEWRYLAAEARSDYAALESSSASSVIRLALSPDGRMLALSRLNGNVELWNPASLRRVATLETNLSYNVGLAFSPTSRLLAASAGNGPIRLWQLDPLRVASELAHTNLAIRLAFSPDGRYLASASLINWVRGEVCVWDLETRQVVRYYPGFIFRPSVHGAPICFSPDGRQLALGGDSGRIRTLDWANNRVLLDIPAHDQEVTSLAYSPDGKLLASGGGYSAEDIRLWSAATGQTAGSLAGHRGWICDLQFSADGQRLLSASADQTIGIWDVPTRRLIQKLRGHLDEVYSIALDERRTNLITGCKDGSLALWDLARVREHGLRLDLPAQTQCPAYAASRGSVAILDQRGAVALWHPEDPQRLSMISALGCSNAALAVAYQRGLVACATPEGPVRIWSLNSASLVTNLSLNPGQLDGLSFSKNEDSLVAANGVPLRSVTATVWDAKTWTKRCSFETTDWESFCGDGRLLVVGFEDGSLAWRDAVRGQRLAQTICHHRNITGLDFSPDGSMLASVSSDGTVALWDTKARRRTACWKADFLGLCAVSFSPDGTRLVTGLTGGRAARVWDLKTRRELLTLAAPGNAFRSVRFSSDGDTLLCGSDDGHCYLWRAPSFAELDGAR
jgi:WD40 repeat protein/tRNA A-37 threonylcarbamoyl transferase component Bud32